MEHFIDDLSKKLAGALSRRDMLRVTGRSFFAALVASTPIGKMWASTTTSAGDVGSSSCGAVQRVAQLAFPNPTKFSNHGSYVSAVASSVSAALDATLITKTCSECIVGQFGSSVPVNQQQLCGTVQPPTAACQAASQKQVETASILAFSAAPNAWGDGNQWALWLTLTQEILSCTFVTEGNTPSATSFEASSVATTSAQATACAQSGVNYCGPGNSADPNNPFRALRKNLEKASFSGDFEILRVRIHSFA